MAKNNEAYVTEMLETFKKLIPKNQKHIFELILMANMAEQSVREEINKGA